MTLWLGGPSAQSSRAEGISPHDDESHPIRVHYRRGRLYYEAGLYHQAEEEFAKAVELAESSGLRVVNAPQVDVSIPGQSQRALTSLKEVRAARRETRKQLKSTNRQVDRLEEQLERLERQEQELSVEQVESLRFGSEARNRAIEAIEATQHERQQAVRELQRQQQLVQGITDQLHVIDRTEGYLYYNQGVDYHERGDYGRAAKLYRKADALASGDTDVLVNLAAAYISEGEHRRAADALERVLEHSPGLPDVLLNLGMLYDDYLDNENRALAYYQLYLKAAPNAPEAEQVRSWEQEARQVLEQPSW